MSIYNFPEITGDLLSTNCMIRCQAVNCCGTMDTGLNAQVKGKYPEAAQLHAEMCKLFGAKLLGEVQFVPCHDGTIIANMFVRETDSGNLSVLNPPVLEECLDRLCIFVAKTGASLGIPKDLGQREGEWDEIRALIQSYLGTKMFDCRIVNHVSAEEPTATPKKEAAKEEKPAAKADNKPEPVKAEEPKQPVTNSSRPSVSIIVAGTITKDSGPNGWAAKLSSRKTSSKTITGSENTDSIENLELMAVIAGLSALKAPCNVELSVTSFYISEAIKQGWLKKWSKNWEKCFATYGNATLWKELEQLMQVHNVSVVLRSDETQRKAG